LLLLFGDARLHGCAQAFVHELTTSVGGYWKDFICSAEISAANLIKLSHFVYLQQRARALSAPLPNEAAVLDAEKRTIAWINDANGALDLVQAAETHWQIRDNQRNQMATDLLSPKDDTLYIMWDFKDILPRTLWEGVWADCWVNVVPLVWYPHQGAR
jgi:hypothetical protein